MTDGKYEDIVLYEFRSGWNDLVDSTLDQILGIDPDLEILQIKEKFGTLRIYFSSSLDWGAPNAMLLNAIVDAAEKHSASVCETCGLPGQLLVRNHWCFTACEKHAGEGLPADD